MARHGQGPRQKFGRSDYEFTDPIIRGTSLFHCHLLKHEDQRMMAKIFQPVPLRAGRAAAKGAIMGGGRTDESGGGEYGGGD